MIADGATSKLAMQMGYCTEPPKGVCSRAFIEGGTHNVDFDGEAFSVASHCSRPHSKLAENVSCLYLLELKML